MRKKIISLILLLLLFSSFVLPASASDKQWINVLKYGFPEGFTGNAIVRNEAGNDLLLYSVPSGQYYYYDFVVSSNWEYFSANVYGSKNKTTLQIGPGVWRVYGEYNGDVKDTLELLIAVAGQGTGYEILSFNVSNVNPLVYPSIASVNIPDYYFEVMPNPDTPVTALYPNSGFAVDLPGTIEFNINFTEWEKFDRQTVWLEFENVQPNSITAFFTDIELPIESDIYVWSNNNYTLYNPQGTGELASTYFQAKWILAVTLDFTNLDRSVDYSPLLKIVGNRNMRLNSSCKIQSVDGYVDSSNASPFQFFMYKAKIFFTSQFNDLKVLINNLLMADNTSGEEFQEDVASQATEFDNLNGEFNSVTKPPVTSVQSSVSDYVSESDIQSSTSPLLEILNSNIFTSVIMMSLILALGSYVLYGKR